MLLSVDERYKPPSSFADSIQFLFFSDFNWIAFITSWRKFAKRGLRRDWAKPLLDQISPKFPPPPVSNFLLISLVFLQFKPCMYVFSNPFISEIVGINKSDSANRLSEVVPIVLSYCLMLFHVQSEFRFLFVFYTVRHWCSAISNKPSAKEECWLGGR